MLKLLVLGVVVVGGYVLVKKFLDSKKSVDTTSDTKDKKEKTDK